MIVLDVEFYSLSNGIIFNADHRTIMGCFVEIDFTPMQGFNTSISCPDSLKDLC